MKRREFHRRQRCDIRCQSRNHDDPHCLHSKLSLAADRHGRTLCRGRNDWKRDDQEFSAAWEDAVETGVDKVETALVKRAIKNSDTAAIAYLKSAGALRTQGVR
jgi:hypothetical protein